MNENGLTVVGLKFPGDLGHSQCPCIERLLVVGRTVPLLPEPHHILPVHPHKSHCNKRDHVSRPYMHKQQIPCNVPDSEHAQHRAVIALDVLQVVNDVDGEEDRACEDGDEREEPSEHAKKTKECRCIEANFVYEFRFFGV